MQSVRILSDTLERLADRDHYLFTLRDLHAILPDHSFSAFKTLVSRASRTGTLKHLCRNLYIYEKAGVPRDKVLFHAAARLRAGCFNYLSLETVLSDSGRISQIPFSWITLMTSGRSGQVRCGSFGTIEFVHTAKTPARLAPGLAWDQDCRLWRASDDLAIADMRATRRPMDLVDKGETT